MHRLTRLSCVSSTLVVAGCAPTIAPHSNGVAKHLIKQAESAACYICT